LLPLRNSSSSRPAKVGEVENGEARAFKGKALEFVAIAHVESKQLFAALEASEEVG
jgi:hypothetical protein